jgi:hypothetical protein
VLLTVGLCLGLAQVQAGEHDFVGSKKCKACHLKQYKSWETTTMATTFDALKPGERAEAKKAAGLDPAKDYTKDAECLPCHVTGYGKPGGFVDIETTPTLAGVGCEWCHGAGGTYVKSEYMSLKNKEYKKADIVAVGLVDKVSEAQCLPCHNDKSPTYKEFTFDTEKGTHEHHPLKYEH